MPIYEYVCKSCGHQLEALQKMSDSPLTECPQCRDQALVKKISAAGFRLAGSGWYETDFKSGGTKRNLAGGGDSDKPPKADAKKDASAKTKTADTGSAAK
jgi:putative FmdB family regulatory protein